MKKFILLILLVLPCSISAQIIFSDSVRHEMRRYLYNAGDALNPDTYTYGNLWIRSKLTGTLIDFDTKSNSIDIISFKDASPHTYRHILLVYNDKYHMINMNQSYSEIMKDLLSFFDNNPEIDDRVLLLFNKYIYKVFLSNTLEDEKGQWYDWWNQRDSLSKQLNVKYEDW